MENSGCDISTSGLNVSQKQSSILTMQTGAREVASFTFSQSHNVSNVASYFF